MFLSLISESTAQMLQRSQHAHPDSLDYLITFICVEKQCVEVLKRGWFDDMTTIIMTICIEFQKGTTCMMLECCRHLHKLCIHNPCTQRWGTDSVYLDKAVVAPYRLAGSAPHKSGDVESNPSPTTHTHTNSLQ